MSRRSRLIERQAHRLKATEALAKRIIEGVEVGGRMVYREDQSVRTHDFDLHRTAGILAAVEVSSLTAPNRLAKDTLPFTLRSSAIVTICHRVGP